MSANSDDTIPNVIDHSVKRLFRSQPQAVLHLAGIEGASVRFEDSNLNIPQLSADHVFLIDQIDENGVKRTWALYLEYQLTPKPDLLKSWGIKQSGLPHKNQVELLGIAAWVASRRFSKAVLQAIFKEEFGMLEEQDNLMEMFLDMGTFDRWLQDPRISEKLQSIAKAKGREEGREEGEAKGEAKGREEGRADAMRQSTLTFLTFRFGELPQSLVERIKVADATWCEQLFQQATTVESLTELKRDTE